jgi:preprotein translocase subunit SecF
MQFFRSPNLDIIGARRKAMLVSAIAILIGLGSMLFHRGLATSIDFAGGALVEVRLEKPVPLQELRGVIDRGGFSGAEVTHFGAEREYLIKVKAVGDAVEVADSVKTLVSSEFGGQNVDIRRTETVGPKIGAELKTAAFWAVIYSLIGIIVYITWRFQFRFAIAAIIALIHDVLFTLGFFSVMGLEISLAVIAAILTIVGYSLNDTIVVFDRIRENLHGRRRENYARLVNSSINETLSRTIITSLTTLFVVLSLVVFGGAVIRDFALTLMIGVIVGTYSSIFIASPILVEWQDWKSARSQKAARTPRTARAGKPAKPAKARH